jgi:hypothetical protein
MWGLTTPRRTDVQVDYRAPSQWERDVLKRMLTADFPGVAQLREQAENVSVRTLDDDGSFQIKPEGGPLAKVGRRVVSDAHVVDSQPPTFVLLHVVGGFLSELEIYAGDGSPVIGPIPADRLVLR